MNKEFKTKYFIVADSTDFDYEPNSVAELLDRFYEEQATLLKMGKPFKKGIPVHFNNSNSEADNGTIRIKLQPESRGLTFLNWLELIFRHEITHVLVSNNVKSETYPVIFWEGIPVYLADNKVREEILGFNYHELSKVFLDKKAMVSIQKIIHPHLFYGKRRDFRVDIIAGSFTGYLIERYGCKKLFELLNLYVSPSPVNPVMEINPILNKVYSRNLIELESDWHEFLENEIKENQELNEKYSDFSFSKEIELSSVHCKFCCFPIEEHETICSNCSADNSVLIEIN